MCSLASNLAIASVVSCLKIPAIIVTMPLGPCCCKDSDQWFLGFDRASDDNFLAAAFQDAQCSTFEAN
jgi:hypothetical protein